MYCEYTSQRLLPYQPAFSYLGIIILLNVNVLCNATAISIAYFGHLRAGEVSYSFTHSFQLKW